jgi:anthranilate/para-aminobenzoate synthase component I
MPLIQPLKSVLSSPIRFNCQSRAPNTSSIEINEVSGDRPWTDAVKQAVSEIKAGRLDKVVLARALDITSQQNFDPNLVLDSLRQSYPECINFAINFGGQATFLGATPELLLQSLSILVMIWRSKVMRWQVQPGAVSIPARIVKWAIASYTAPKISMNIEL